MTNMEYIRKSYAVPAKRGMRVTYRGTCGTITGAVIGRLRVRMHDTGMRIILHPWDENLQYEDAEPEARHD